MQFEAADRIRGVVPERLPPDGDQPIRLNETNCYGPFDVTVNPSNFIEKTEGSRLRLM